jgi:hypothetical protein
VKHSDRVLCPRSSNPTEVLDKLIEEWHELTLARQAMCEDNFSREANLMHNEEMLKLRDSLELACDKVMMRCSSCVFPQH